MDRQVCGDCPYGGKGVGTRGPIDAPVCIVGEAPGTNELDKGVPFIGQAGQLLGRTLARAGIREEEVFITNALRCRPPIGKPPTTGAIQACQSRLLAEVTSAPRTLILALGNTALRALSGNYDAKITQERGRARTLDLGGRSVLVVPTFHPAAVLRSPGELPKLLDDVKYASSLVAGRVSIRHPGDVTYEVATRDTYRDLIDLLLINECLACDIETSGFNPRRNRILSLGVSYDRNKAVVFPGKLLRSFPGPFHRLFGNKNATFIWHNGKYDAAFLRQLGLPARVDEDTMLLHYVLSEGNRDLHGLKDLSADLLGADPHYDDEVKKYAPKMTDSYAKVPHDILYRYNAQDTDHTWQLFQILRPQLNKPGNETLRWNYQNLIIPMSAFLQDVEHAGIWVHTPTLVELRREFEVKLASAEDELQEVAATVWDSKKYAVWKGTTKIPVTFSPGSPYQLRWVLSEFGLHPKDPRTKKASTNAAALKDLPQVPFVVSLGKYRNAQKMLSTYVEGIERAIDRDGRVHATYLIHGTATGRLSSRGPNMQNVPRDKHIRNVFQAPPDRTFVELDYSQVELRVLAYLSGDRGLWDIYTNKRDLHDEVAASLFPGWQDHKDTVLGREQRIRAKFVNFGIAYGRGAESMVAEFKMPVTQASQIIRNWWATFPEAHRFIVQTRAASRSGRPLETPLGRRRRFGLITNMNRNALENEAANFPIQSTASDLTILSALTIHPSLTKWNARIINLVHDSILIECPKEHAEVVAEYAKSVMERLPGEVLETNLPFDVGMSIGQRWGDLK